MNPHEPQNLRRTGAIVLALATLALIAALTRTVPFVTGEHGPIVTARMSQANEVHTDTPVRVGGITVGHVVGLRRGPGATTDMQMRITREGVRIHADARADIRWRTLLGGSMYVDLAPGSSTAGPLAGTIPLDRTSTQVDWDQFNSQLPTQTRLAARHVLKGLRHGLSDPPPVQRLLRDAGPDLATIGRGTAALRGSRAGDLTTLVHTTASTLRAVTRDDKALERLVVGADRTLAVTASHTGALGRALELSPAALSATTQTSRELDVTLTRLTPLVDRLRPGVRVLAPTTRVLDPLLRRAGRVVDHAEPLLRAAAPALRALGRTNRDGTPLLRSLDPVLRRLDDDLLPFLARRDEDSHLRTYEAVGPVASDLADATSPLDDIGHAINFGAELSPTSVLLPCDPGLQYEQLARCNQVNTILQSPPRSRRR